MGKQYKTRQTSRGLSQDSNWIPARVTCSMTQEYTHTWIPRIPPVCDYRTAKKLLSDSHALYIKASATRNEINPELDAKCLGVKPLGEYHPRMSSLKNIVLEVNKREGCICSCIYRDVTGNTCQQTVAASRTGRDIDPVQYHASRIASSPTG